MEEIEDYSNYVTTPEEFKECLTGHFHPKRKITILNVGSKVGISRDFAWIQDLSKDVEVFGLEYDPNFAGSKKNPHNLYGDICHCPEIADNSFDLIYIVNVLEHTFEPWEAAKECVRICKSNGVIIVCTPFSWHYHKHPVDFWRFTPDGLEHLFKRTEQIETIKAGFKGYCWFKKKEGPRPGTKPGLESLYLCKKK